MSTSNSTPEWADVKSSNVSSVAHDPAKSELHVRYKSGGHYCYEGVDADKAQQLLASDSIGGYIHRSIKGKHNARKVADD